MDYLSADTRRKLDEFQEQRVRFKRMLERRKAPLTMERRALIDRSRKAVEQSAGPVKHGGAPQHEKN